jgi:hypothetical protein
MGMKSLEAPKVIAAEAREMASRTQ